MAMKGTIDTFDLSDVVALITGTGKSGDLEVEGDHATGTVSFVDGRVTASECVRAAQSGHEVVLFELLRNRTGSYSFNATDDAAASEDDVDGEDVLAAAQDLMAEWVDIIKVVPGGTAYITLSSDIEDDTITIGPNTWQIIRAVGSGSAVSDVGAAFDVGEFDACRAAKRLIDLGIARITEPPIRGESRTNGTKPPATDEIGSGVLTKFLASTDN